MSKRKVASFCRDVGEIPLTPGAVCKIEPRVKQALRPAVAQARTYVQSLDTNVDETPWPERSRHRWLWTVVTPQVSVFPIAPSRGAPVLQALLGRTSAGGVSSDRAKAYDTRPLGARQVCWAHLRRDFQVVLSRSGSRSSCYS
jgi:transposase